MMEKAFTNIIKSAIAESMVESLRDGTITLNDEPIKDLVYVSIDNEHALKILKAIGLIHFEGNKEAQLIVNDFIGLLSDMYDEGEISMTEFKKNKGE